MTAFRAGICALHRTMAGWYPPALALAM